MKRFPSTHALKRTVVSLFMILVLLVPLSGCSKNTDNQPIGMAVEFMDHASGAFIALDQGWYKDEGLNLTSFDSYATGMALAAALARDDIQVAYLCLTPAINLFANAGVPIKIVAGTHKYGFGLVVNPEKIKTVSDLEDEGMRIGCVKEGGAVDVLLHKSIDYYNLDEQKVLANVRRMSPQNMALAIKAGQLDAAFMPEHWASLGESFGFTMLVTAQDVWPEMQGSVLIVKQRLIDEHPDIVEKLVKVSEKATDFIHNNPEQAAEIVARQLNEIGDKMSATDSADSTANLVITPEVIERSMSRLDFTPDIDVAQIQEAINYAVKLGYIPKSFNAEDMLDLQFVDK